jgi:hypothetical protein
VPSVNRTFGENRLNPGAKGRLAIHIITVPSKGETDLSSETAQQYIQRMGAFVEGKRPLAVQAATAKKLERIIEGLPTNKLRKRPTPDKWSVSEILAHLADSEIVLGFRMRFILGAPGTPITAVDQDAWVTSGHYEKRDPRKSVEQFRAFREANLALLKTLTPQQWKHYGMHSERGQETIERMVLLYAGHDLNHLQQIERILSAKAAPTLT